MASTVPFYDKPKGVGFFFTYEFDPSGAPKEIRFYEGTTILEEFEDIFSFGIEVSHTLRTVMQKQFQSTGMSIQAIDLYVHPGDMEVNIVRQVISISYAFQVRTIIAVSPDWSRHQPRTNSVADVQRKLADIRAYYTALRNVSATMQKSGTPVKKTSQEQHEEVERRKLPTKLEILHKKYKLPNIEEDGFYVTEENWYYTLRSIDRKQSIMFTGPSGCGKTSLVRLALTRMEKPMKKYNMGAMHDALTGLIGQHILKGGESVFKYADFYNAIQSPNGILLDEISRAPANANNILFTVLDDSRELHVDIAHDVHIVKVDPEVNFMATANLGAEYTGSYQMDRALVDRFGICEIGFMSADIEAKVLIKRTGVEASSADMIAKVAEGTRVLKSKDQLSDCVSPRLTLETAELVVDGFSLETAMKIKFLPLFEGDKETGDRGSVFKMIHDEVNKKSTKSTIWD